MVSVKNSNIHVFRNSKSIFIFQKWTKINVQKSLSENNLGFSKNVAFYIINWRNNLKRNRTFGKADATFG
jgi:hypothetical protein